MKKTYLSPEVTAYGSVAELTGVIGAQATMDVLIDANGNVVLSSNQSRNACETGDFEECA